MRWTRKPAADSPGPNGIALWEKNGQGMLGVSRVLTQGLGTMGFTAEVSL
jgi:hypothetical protein